MAGEFLCTSMSFKSADWADPRYSRPDWKNGRSYIEKLRSLEQVELEGLSDVLEELGICVCGNPNAAEEFFDTLSQAADHVERVFEGAHREGTFIVQDDGIERILVSGGESWGSEPTVLYRSMQTLEMVSFWQQCGVIDGWIGSLRLYTAVLVDWGQGGKNYVIQARASCPAEAINEARRILEAHDRDLSMEAVCPLLVFEGVHRDLFEDCSTHIGWG